MAQGQIKRPAKTGPSSKKSSSQTPKHRVIKPKKAKLIQQRKLIRKHTSGLTAMTEKNLAQRAGHLEILAGGKKDSKGDGKKKGGK
ncbi:MAG: DUF2462 domain-containing protein [Terriglobus roseus]|nr:DUF2462 domain-containing protein [Terriglobus roseus]